MVKDTFLRILFIPLLGISISFISGIITYSKYSSIEIAGALIYFMFVSWCIWVGCHWLHLKLRRIFAIDVNPLIKIASLTTIACIYGAAVSCVMCLLWLKISYEHFNRNVITGFIVLSVMPVILFTLVYEVVYLSKERQRDTRTVGMLDNELTRAEVAVLRNELDPHFIFNSLNTLSYLITTDVSKADLFTNKLAQVYSYLLTNKDREQVSLEKEIKFIEDYIFLIRIRHENRVELEIDLQRDALADILIIPCAIQLLIENAIKHNDFTMNEHLKISISMDRDYLKIENSVNRKIIPYNSTKIGLRNLSEQYYLILKKNIIIEKNENRFLVKLPFTKKTYAPC